MTWVKICGTTNLEDALTAADAGANAVGFVFYEKSPRNISLEAARKIVEKLPEGIEKIGVFVHGEGPESLDALWQAGLTGAQTYVSEENDLREGWKAIGAEHLPKGARLLLALPMRSVGKNGEQIEQLASHLTALGRTSLVCAQPPEGLKQKFGFVLDSGDMRMPGGTGKIFDWKKATPIAEGARRGGLNLVVAGGLTPENVGEAISILKPWGVDVVSGVEAWPGKKDPKKIRAFVKAVREINREIL